MSKAYIAVYPLSADGKDLDEQIIESDTFWSPRLINKWNSLVSNRKPNEPMLQGWYSDSVQALCVASTNQPFKLD